MQDKILGMMYNNIIKFFTKNIGWKKITMIESMKQISISFLFYYL